jgi:death on curing protein
VIEYEFLSVAYVLRLHEDQIDAYGGDLGVRDMGLIESAVAQPQATFMGTYLHTDVFEMAAAYAFHLAESQAFTDGNKRTGLAAAYHFLGLNGYDISDDGKDDLFQSMIDISSHKLSKKGLAGVLRKLAVPVELSE